MIFDDTKEIRFERIIFNFLLFFGSANFFQFNENKTHKINDVNNVEYVIIGYVAIFLFSNDVCATCSWLPPTKTTSFSFFVSSWL